MLAADVIVIDQGTELRVITQPDHAHFAAELMSLWRSHGLPDHPRRADLLFAIREHDNGWWEADAAPRVAPSLARPRDFRGYPDEARLEIWRRGISRFASSRPYVALLIALHAETIHRLDQSPWQEFFETLDPEREAWRESIGIDEPTLRADHRFLSLADSLSLAVCQRHQAPVESLGVSGVFDNESLVLEPFPLAGATTFRIPCRWIPNRSYERDSELGAALAGSRWGNFPVRVVPARETA